MEEEFNYWYPNCSHEGFQHWNEPASEEEKEWYDRQQPTEELTPEGVQYVLPGAERETTPSKEKEQGTLW